MKEYFNCIQKKTKEIRLLQIPFKLCNTGVRAMPFLQLHDFFSTKMSGLTPLEYKLKN
jgi:hypothetical protein